MANAADSKTLSIEELSITKGNKKISLDRKTTSFDYYESLLSPNITAILTYADTGSTTQYSSQYDSQERLGTIYNSLPITGDGSEEIRFKFRNSLGILDFTKNPLIINSAINPDQESNRESVALSLVSKSGVKNQETHVKKNYSSSSNNSQSVRKIAKELLEISDDKLHIENTKDRWPFIGNNKSPFDILCTLASKSSPEKGYPGFFFYENSTGHHFKSIDNLISQEPVQNYYKTGITKSSVNVDNSFKISSFSVNKNQNLINAMKSGVYSNRTIVFNPKTFKEEEIDFNLDTLESALGKKEVSRPKDRKYTRVIYGIKDVGFLSPGIKETETNTTNPKQWGGKVQMRYNLLLAQVTKMQVPLNPSLKAGDVIKCNFEIISGSKKEEGTIDPVQSGKYLIMDLCHHYDTERSFTSMTLVRDTYGLHTNKN